MKSEEKADLIESMDRMQQGQTHLFCALTTALERSGALKREDLKAVLDEKIAWLGHHNAVLEIATPVLLARDWLISPPRNPGDPYDGGPRDYLRPVPRK